MSYPHLSNFSLNILITSDMVRNTVKENANYIKQRAPVLPDNILPFLRKKNHPGLAEWPILFCGEATELLPLCILQA